MCGVCVRTKATGLVWSCHHIAVNRCHRCHRHDCHCSSEINSARHLLLLLLCSSSVGGSSLGHLNNLNRRPQPKAAAVAEESWVLGGAYFKADHALLHHQIYLYLSVFLCFCVSYHTIWGLTYPARSVGICLSM